MRSSINTKILRQKKKSKKKKAYYKRQINKIRLKDDHIRYYQTENLKCIWLVSQNSSRKGEWYIWTDGEFQEKYENYKSQMKILGTGEKKPW